MTNTMIGVIGGSGLYDIEGLEGRDWVTIETPWGAPSDAILRGTLDGVEMAFLPRHGRGHVQTPASINYRANIDALKRLGVTDVISVSACGSFREEMAPGISCIIDSSSTAHSPARRAFSAPAASPMSRWRIRSARGWAMRWRRPPGARHSRHRGGTYLAMEGPQFSSLAESKLYRESGAAT